MADERESDRVARDTISSAKRGQVLVLMALMIAPICLMLGLIIDLGYAYGQKRLTQNLADNAAIAGSQIISKQLVSGTPVTNGAVAQAICDVAAKGSGDFNSTATRDPSSFCGGTGFYVTGVLTVTLGAIYLDSNGVPLASNSTVINNTNPLPSGAAGVQVTRGEGSPTFFATVAPLGLRAIPVQSTAKALANVVTSYSGDSPNFAAFAVWYSHKNSSQVTCGQFLAPNAGCSSIGRDVTFQSSQYCSNGSGHIVPTAYQTLCNSNFKGDLNSQAGITINAGVPILFGVRSVPDPPANTIVVIPVIDEEDVSPYVGEARVIGFVAVLVDSGGQSGVVQQNMTTQDGGGSGGTPPPTGVPPIVSVKLIQ
jgi:Flp pilus assembly protein TadG